MDAISDDELLFFGSVMTNFAYHPGTVHQIHLNSIDELQFQNSNGQSSLHSKAAESSSSNDTNYDRIVLPDLPTKFIQIPASSDHPHNLSDDFCQPLIKTELPSRLRGIISGARSALIKSNSSKWYRLKGCGNHTESFPIKPISDFSTKVTIRGCAFVHTTCRELFMTHYISHLLSAHQIECANTSSGWFEYTTQPENIEKIHLDIPVVQDVNLTQWPNVTRCCILMETLGNKRLSDHLLYGIEQLFSLIICDHQSHPVNQSDLISLFPVDRLTPSDQNPEQLVPLSTWFASLTNILQPVDYQKSNWLHTSARFSEEIPTAIEENRWRVLWKTSIDTLNNYLQTETSLSNLLCLLYKRLGFECGSILGLMHHHRISWGTYTDELGTHCNAHPNNVVVKLPSTTSPFLLAPLDFDMSFTETNYLPNRMNNQSFDTLIQLELSGFRLTLGGDSQASTGVTAWLEISDDQWISVRWLLRDLMLNEFNNAYTEAIRDSSVKSVHSFSKEEHHACQSLIHLALLQTMKEIG